MKFSALIFLLTAFAFNNSEIGLDKSLPIRVTTKKGTKEDIALVEQKLIKRKFNPISREQLEQLSKDIGKELYQRNAERIKNDPDYFKAMIQNMDLGYQTLHFDYDTNELGPIMSFAFYSFPATSNVTKLKQSSKRYKLCDSLIYFNNKDLLFDCMLDSLNKND